MLERRSFPDNNVNKQSKERVESLFYKISTCLQKTTTCLGLRAEKYISSKYILYIFFNIGRGFYDSFTMLLLKASPFCCKNFLN